MRGGQMVALAVVQCLAAETARADEPAGPTPDGEAREPKLIPTGKAQKSADSLGMSHKGQLEASLRMGVGLRAIIPYNDEFCGEVDEDGNSPVCTTRAPFALDFELGYGVGRKIDLLLELRVGIEGDFGKDATDTDDARVFHLSPGARFFFSESKSTKLFTTAQLVLDLSSYKDLAGESAGTDFGFRNLNGLWWDLDRAYGFYVFVGETASFARWLRFELEAGIGIQGRYR